MRSIPVSSSASLLGLRGVRSAGAANFIPINTQSWGQDIYIEGAAPRPAGDSHLAGHRSVSLDYFRTIGIRRLRGREFAGQDRAIAGERHQREDGAHLLAERGPDWQAIQDRRPLEPVDLPS